MSSMPAMSNSHVTQKENRKEAEEDAAEAKKRHFLDSVGCGDRNIRPRATSKRVYTIERFEDLHLRAKFAGPSMLST